MKNATLIFKKVYLYQYKLDSGILDFNIISNSIDKFFIDVINPLTVNQYVTFQFMYKLSDNTFRTLGYLNKINKNDLEKLKSSLLFFHQNDFDQYNEAFKETIAIYIKYRYLDMTKTENKSLIVDIRNNKKGINTHLVNKINIPSMYNTESWGIIKYKKELHNFTVYSIIRGNYTFEIIQTSISRDVTIFCNNNLILEFIDKFVNDTYFIRTLKDTNLHFIDNKEIVKITDKKDIKFISKIKEDSLIINNIITLDLETISKLVNNEEVLQVISCCIYDGVNKTSFYLSDYKSSDDLLINAINSLLIDKYNNYKIYIHNLSSFDGIFLLRILAKLHNTKLIPIIKDDKMIALNLKFGKNKITFHDSMLLLPSSLDKLSKAFNVINKKSIFPIKWLLNNPNFSLAYIGAVPEIKYFKDISLSEYNNYVLERFNIWNFRKELLYYNMVDCIALYEILIKFNELIYEKFGLNVFNYPTLPSLAFAIYRSSFMNDYKIPKIGGKMLHDIRKSYTGGATEMYIPYGENLYHYDINSLYPTSMLRFDMPVGHIKSFKGNILNIMDNPFGFFKCKITAPKFLDNPILQIRYNDRTISPLGTFTGWFFSEELLNATNYGYNYEILEGYLFEKDNIFKEYVSVLHEMKQSSEKSSPMYLISKLLMNSLYGKFGMSDDLAVHVIVDSTKLDKLLETKTKLTSTELDEDLFLLSYHEINDNKLISDNTEYDISIGVASAITAYSRVQMSQFKNLANNKMYYTDTDSAVMEKQIDYSLVGNHLGQMVLEKEYKEFVSLAPKVYGGILTNGKEFTKIKGFKNSITFETLKSLLEENKSLELQQTKWFRFINKGSITIKNQIYTLVATANKRKIIYKDKKLFKTQAFILDNHNDLD
jgi:hypothetical protein